MCVQLIETWPLAIAPWVTVDLKTNVSVLAKDAKLTGFKVARSKIVS